ncbi:glycoside hydrolase family 3 protein [Paenibacillus sacheonensis]|uniref:Glycoside hydrolase n=1 Tax=Paenibacillus sacheonensis TaxID=742054 RepID=A0A7X4YSL0_9BACL|nr:glycoside hydrolase family 3 protein [Paenibacillus sacheonensis]MBM7569205.1 beta-N-acetylhexosaminidase [Paenibacillus sacheonensis]NBC71783.1 glycoside hydrolase [Paenibacillus sacheonensis]
MVEAWGNWSLREKIGQLFVFGFHGHEPSGDIAALIGEFGVGGIIYFTRNIDDAEQVHGLTTAFMKAAADAGRYPMFIAVDQEGGMVSRLVKGVTLMPGNMALGAAGDSGGVFETASICGEQLRALGINLNFAPCVDVNNNPDNPVINVRSYGDKPEVVGELGLAAVRGYQRAGVSATAKHFPGHGDTSVDSHRDLPVLTHDRDRLEAVELVPFKAIAGEADMVMTAHVCLPAIDPSGLPSTLSAPVLTGLLREELDYGGVIVTDCLEMNAIDKFYGPERGAVLALQAGADMVLVCHTPSKQRAAIEAVAAAVERGDLTEARIEASLARIMSLKAKRKVGEPLQPWAEAAPKLHTPEQAAAARQWSEASVTLVKNEGGLLPLKRSAKTLVLWPSIVTVSEADELLTDDGTLGARLSIRMLDVTERLVDDADALEGLEAFEQIVYVSYDAAKLDNERDTARRLMALAGNRTIAVSVRNPLDLLVYPEVSTFLALYECRPLALESAARALIGEIKPQGRLPLTLSEQYPYGWRWEAQR